VLYAPSGAKGIEDRRRRHPSKLICGKLVLTLMNRLEFKLDLLHYEISS
jgi:hypothetical protein